MPFVIVEYQRSVQNQSSRDQYLNFCPMETLVLGLSAELLRQMTDYKPIPVFPEIPPSHANWKPGCTKFQHCPTVILNALEYHGFKVISTNVEVDATLTNKHYTWTMSSEPTDPSSEPTVPQAYSTKINL